MSTPANYRGFGRDAAASPTAAEPREVWFDGLQTEGQADANWIWDGYLAPGQVTLLTSQWKTGKTTLLAILLAKLKTGGTFAGRTLRPAKSAIVSEEHANLWLLRSQQLDLSGQVCWFCRPFRGKPTLERWQGLINRLIELRQSAGIELVVIDSLAAFFPGRSENDSNTMMETLLSLQQLTALGLSVLILHHPRKERSPEGQLARGSGALPSFADILIEMHPFASSLGDRRRRLQAFSRYPSTPTDLLIELNAAGTDYIAHGEFDERSYSDSWSALERIFSRARGKLSRLEIHSEWPDDCIKPSDSTLRRWLEKAHADGKLERDGDGTKSHPYCYWLKSREEQWRRDPLGLDEMVFSLDGI